MNQNPPKDSKVKWEVLQTLPEAEPHHHYFEWVRSGECKCRCGFGLIGVVELKDGKPVL